jgi:hypothetical protein
MGKTRKQTGEKFKLSDIAAAWKAGWTPDDVNALLDRFEAMGDPNDPPAPDLNDDLDDDLIDDVPSDDENPDDLDDNDDPDDDLPDDDPGKADVRTNLDKLKKTGLEVQISDLEVRNKRLENEVSRLKAQNRNKDVSGVSSDDISPEQALINVFQSCY